MGYQLTMAQHPQGPYSPHGHHQPAQPPGSPPKPTHVGVILGGLWAAVGLLGALATGVVAATQSEQTGVDASMIGVPLFFSGLVAVVTAFIVRRKSKGVAMGAPVGCGCGSLVAGVLMMVLFYAAIWPSL